VSDDPTVAACWDSDRLDIGRYGKRLLPALLSTERASELGAALPEPLDIGLADVIRTYRGKGRKLQHAGPNGGMH
jgi:hypothetical protein